MKTDFTITKITRIIYVSASEYPETKTRFSANINCNELIFHFSGDAILHLGGKEYRLQKNTLRFMPKGEYGNYDLFRIENGDCIDIFFETDKPVESGVICRRYANHDKLSTLFNKIFNLWMQADKGYYFSCMSVLYDILSRVLDDAYMPNSKYEKIAPAVSYITEHFLKEEIRCETLTSLCGVSQSYLQKLFKEKYQLSPKQYVIQMRMKYACDLLLSGLFSINQVSEQCGFTDPAFFSRQFRKYLGSSPRNFVKKHESSK